MKKVVLAIIINILCITLATAQNQSGDLSAKVVDGDLNNLPIIGATVEITPLDGEPISIYYSTDVNGVFEVPAIRFGDYSITVHFLGYESTTVDASINSSRTILPDIALSSSPIAVETVVKNISLRASQSGDSLRYNASAYKVTEDADVEGLLQKMPGIVIEDGQLSAQGEQIKKIYIDGKEFFGDDVTMALKSLPAEVVDRIELFDKLSDEAEYSGVDDGNSSKSINIVTKPNMREGVFGKLFAGGGYEPNPIEGGDHGKYMAGGNLNLFNEKRRITVIGLLNNLNQQNFSFEDIMGVSEDESVNTSDFMVKRLPGVAKVNALGVNYSESFGKDERVKVQGSYFFNTTTTTNSADMTRWYEAPATEDIDSLYQVSNSVTDNLNNRITSRIDIKISDRQSLMIRPTVSFQNTDQSRSTSGVRFEEDNYTDNNGMQEYANSSNAVWGGYNYSTYAYYRLRLKDRRSISAGGSIRINSYESDSETTTLPSNPSSSSDTTYKYTTSPSFKRIVTANANYLEPINENLLFNVAYRLSNTYQESDKRTYSTDDDFILDDEATHLTTNYAESSYTTHSVGPGVRFYKGKSRITSNIYYQYSTFDGATTKINTSKESESEYDNVNNYQNITYSLVGNIFFNQENSLRVNITSSTAAPQISRFIDNTSNESYITAGNPDLQPTYNNRLNIRYIRSKIENGSTFMVMFNAYTSKNYITSHIVLSPEPFYDGDQLYDDVLQYTTWVNLDNYWALSSNMTYGFPFEALRSNINLSAGVNYTITPSIYGGVVEQMGQIEGGEESSTGKISYRAGVSLGSNISENIDFTLSWHGDYNDASTATSAALSTKNLYFNQSATAAMKFVFGGGFTFTSNVIYKQYLGITNDYDDRYILCNAFLGHKILKGRRGEVSIGINDILDQNTDFSRYVGNNYTQNTTNYTLGRYVSAQFIYNLRYFKGSSNKRNSRAL